MGRFFAVKVEIVNVKTKTISYLKLHTLFLYEYINFSWASIFLEVLIFKHQYTLACKCIHISYKISDTKFMFHQGKADGLKSIV